MISKKLVYNAAISAQLPSLASHSLKQSFHHCPINVPRKSQFRDGIMNAAFVTIINNSISIYKSKPKFFISLKLLYLQENARNKMS